MITLTSTDSTLVAAQGYDAENKILAIKFVTSPEWTYYYQGFPSEKYAEFKASPSMGNYFLTQIKNKYSFDKQVSA